MKMKKFKFNYGFNRYNILYYLTQVKFFGDSWYQLWRIRYLSIVDFANYLAESKKIIHKKYSNF